MSDSITYDQFRQERSATGVISTANMKPEDEAVLSKQLWQLFWSHSNVWRNQLIEDWDFYLGAQNSQKQAETEKKRQQKTFNADVIYQVVEQAIALLTSNHPRFSATGTEDSDTKIAQIFAYIMQHVWKDNLGNAKLKQTIRDYYVGSVGWQWLYWNPMAEDGNGEFCLDSIDPRRVYVDPASRDFFFRDAAHIIIETFQTAEQMQKNYNITLEELAQFEKMGEFQIASTRQSEFDSGSGSFVPPGRVDSFQRLDRFSRVKVQMVRVKKDDERYERLFMPETAQKTWADMTCIASKRGEITTYFCHPRNVANIMKLYQQYGQVFHEVDDGQGNISIAPGEEGSGSPEGPQPVPGSTTYLALLSMEELVKMGQVKLDMPYVDRIKHYVSIGNKKLYEEVLPTEHYPIVPLIASFDRTPYPVSPVRRVKRSQEFLNAIRQIVVTHAGKVANVKIGYPMGRYKEDKLNEIWADPTKTFIPYDQELSSSGLQVLAPPPLSNFIFTLEAQERKNIQERLGLYAIMDGNPSDAPNTYKGTVALDEYGQRRIKSQRDDIEEFLNQLGRVLVDMVPYYYTDTRVIHIVSPNDKPQTITLNGGSKFSDLMEDNQFRIEDITVGKYDITVVSGSTLPSNRWMLLGEYREMYKEGLVDREAVLKKAEFPDADQIMERMDTIAQLQQQLQSALGQIKQLQGDMQTREREVYHAKMETETTRMKANIKAEETKALAARMIYESTLTQARKLLKGA